MKNENLLTMPSMVISDSSLEAAQDRELKRKFFPKGISILANSINQLHKVSPFLSSKLTMNLLSVAIRKRVKKKDEQFYQKGAKQVFTYKNKTFNVYSYGSGPKVLFIHGWASNGARWKNYVEKIVGKGFTAVVVDAPAQGTSKGFLLSIPDYIQCIKTVLYASESWYGIVSHSVGSLVGVIAASETKIKFDNLKVVLMCTFSDCDALMTKYARCMGIEEGVLTDTKNKIDQIYYEPLTHFSLVDHFKQLDAEGFLLYNPDDIVVPSVEGNKIRRALPALRFFETREGGHNLRSQKVEDEVIKFMGR
ncbi:MAG: alpha/beta fold hydrolase [Saprospiraceae bacterium]